MSASEDVKSGRRARTEARDDVSQEVPSSGEQGLVDASGGPEDLELRYRVRFAATHRRQLMIGLAVFALPMIGFAYSDYRLYGLGASFGWLAALRVFVVVVSGFVIASVHAGRDPKTLDRILLGWWVVLAAAVTAIDATRPPTYILHVAIDVLFVLTAYVLPVRWAVQIAAGAMLTIGPGLVLAFGKTEMPSIASVLCVGAFVYANALGLMLSWNLHSVSRAEFEQRERAQRARTTLRAMSHIVPMCSSCKSIRDSEGRWRHVEEIVQEETGKDVSHSVCDACVRKLYPEFADKVLDGD